MAGLGGADGPLTQRDLGQRLSFTSGAVTMLADRLERAGWVHRRPHPGDRRYVLIELSPLAAASAPEGLAAYHSRIQALAADVPAGQREAVAAFLDQRGEPVLGQRHVGRLAPGELFPILIIAVFLTQRGHFIALASVAAVGVLALALSAIPRLATSKAVQRVIREGQEATGQVTLRWAVVLLDVYAGMNAQKRAIEDIRPGEVLQVAA